MEAEVRDGRAAMIYAVSAGRSVFVPPDHAPTIERKADTMTILMTAANIAQLTAILTGGGYKRAASKEVAVRCFRTVADEKGRTDADAILAMPFKEAKAALRPTAESAVAPKAPGRSIQPVDGPTVAQRRPVTAAKPCPARRAPSKRAAVLAAAQAGTLPTPPDFTAKTHERFRPKLAQVVALVEAGDLAGLRAFQINPVSTSPKAIARYRDLAIIALDARTAKIS